jgi:hypothetical protein
LWQAVHESPLSGWGKGAPCPWHWRQFIAGVCPGGIGAASAWLGAPRWQTMQPVPPPSGKWHVMQWRSDGEPQPALWLSGAVCE